MNWPIMDCGIIIAVDSTYFDFSCLECLESVLCCMHTMLVEWKEHELRQLLFQLVFMHHSKMAYHNCYHC